MSLEDEMMFIYNEVREKGLQEKFDKQLAKKAFELASAKLPVKTSFVSLDQF